MHFTKYIKLLKIRRMFFEIFKNSELALQAFQPCWLNYEGVPEPYSKLISH